MITPSVNIKVTGARGESFADMLRRLEMVPPDSTDELAMDIFKSSVMGSGEVANTLIFYPDQASFNGSLALGTGLRFLNHVGGQDGWYNTAIGEGSGDSLGTGKYNTLIGADSGKNLSNYSIANTFSGVGGNHGNTFIGFFAGAAGNGALDNTLVGTQCGLNITTAMDTCGFGINCLQMIEGGSENAVYGHAGMRALVGNGNWETGDGHRNTGIGDMCGRFLNGGTAVEKTKGKANVYIGARTKSAADYTYNENVFGYEAEGHGDNTVTIGGPEIEETYVNGIRDKQAGADHVLVYDNGSGEVQKDDGSWSVWVPEVKASGGTDPESLVATVASARYRKNMKTIDISVDVTVTDAGTASGSLMIELPFAAAHVHVGSGVEVNATGHQLRVVNCDGDGIYSGTLTHLLMVEQSSSGNIVASGRRYIASLRYEVA